MSPDGAWRWDGAQWVPVPVTSVPVSATSAVAAPAVELAPVLGSRSRAHWGRTLLAAAVLAGVVAAPIAAYVLLNGRPGDSRLSGYAYVATPLSGATVEVHELNDDGTPGSILATTTTDQTGWYEATVKRSSSASLLVTAAGGT